MSVKPETEETLKDIGRMLEKFSMAVFRVFSVVMAALFRAIDNEIGRNKDNR